MKKKIAIIGGIVAAIGLFGGLGWYFLGNPGNGKNDGNVVYVSTVSSLAETASGVQNRYAGVVDPQDTVEVKLESGRIVSEVKVEVGQEVKAGTPLFDYDASASQDDLAQAQLELEQLKNDVLSLQEQLSTLEKEKKEASQDNQLSYTIQIQQTKMDIKKNEYSQKTKSQEIEKLKSAAANTTVTSTIDGVIKSIDTNQLNGESDMLGGDDMMGMNPSGEEGSAFITILGTGTYRVKGSVNEQNAQSIAEGLPVIIRSRVDDEQIWRGTMGAVDWENPESGNNSGGYMAYSMGPGSGGEEQTVSTSYPFYVNLESAEGLMLGQHVYIEMDYGQEEKRDGLWLYSYYVADPEGDPYVWMSNDRDRLEKHPVKLGEYDESLDKYQILDGLSMKDCIAFPTEALEEGLPTEINDGAQIPYTGEETPKDGEELPEADFEDGVVVESGPGSETDLAEEELDAIEASPDGPFAEEILVDEHAVEGVAP